MALFLSHPSSLEHDTGPHPEQAARISAIETALEDRDWFGWDHARSSPVEREVLELVHPPSHIEFIERSCAGGGALDADTLVSPGSWNAALHAAGGAVELVQWLLEAGSGAIGLSAHRPPGHHACSDRAMGFCLFNNIALAASFALSELGLDRVLIVDWDVHHGNGTQDIFWDSDEVLFCSLHEMPLYPGTGAASESGGGAGEGYTVNLPVRAGSGDEVWTGLVRERIVPLALEYRPQLVLVSAGFDAHRDDPLASCLVTEQGFAEMALLLRGVADVAGAPLGLVLEGGYHLGALARSVTAVVEALTED